MAGDDLDDDYAPDGLVAVSEDEGPNDFSPLEGEEDQYVTEELSSPQAPRKRPAPDVANVDDEDAKREKKRRKRQKDNERKAKKQRLTLVDEKAPQDDTFTASQSPADIAALLRKGQVQVMKNISAVELEDLAIPESCIVDSRQWKGERTDATLADFIREVAPTLATRIGQNSKNNGAPTCIILSGNANRVTDLTRSIRPLKGEKGGEICKLFARHSKLSEHAEHLKRTKIGVAVGTPGRISALLNETDSFIVKALSHIVLDVSYMDSKLRSMLDTAETKQEIFQKFFTNKNILERLRNGKASLILF